MDLAGGSFFYEPINSESIGQMLERNFTEAIQGDLQEGRHLDPEIMKKEAPKANLPYGNLNKRKLRIRR